jgi:hypothetical protein
MKRASPTKEQIIQELQRVSAQAPDGRVSLKKFEDETGWDLRYWTNRYWPESGYRGACEEAKVQPGLMFGVETHCLVSDTELALRLAGVMAHREQVPPLARLAAILRMGQKTIARGDSYRNAKERIIRAYFALPTDKRTSIVDERLKCELDKLSDECFPK